MRVIGWIAGVLLLLAVVVFGVGALLPEQHTAIVRAVVPSPLDSVYAALADVEASPAWRSDLDSVRVLSQSPLRWVEHGEFGPITYARFIEAPPGRLGTRIEDAGGAFGGRWVWGLEPEGDATRVTVMEEGEVYNPAFRFLSRFVFGHYGALESVVGDLGRRFGADVAIERVEL